MGPAHADTLGRGMGGGVHSSDVTFFPQSAAPRVQSPVSMFSLSLSLALSLSRSLSLSSLEHAGKTSPESNMGAALTESGEHWASHRTAQQDQQQQQQQQQHQQYHE